MITTSTAPTSVPMLIQTGAQCFPNRAAIEAPNRKPLSYTDLHLQVIQTVEMLNRAGIGRGDRIAIVLPDSAELGVAIFSVCSAATCVFLKPEQHADEFEAMFKRLHINYLIVMQQVEVGLQAAANAIKAAQFCSIPIIELVPVLDGPAGQFTLKLDNYGPSVNSGLAQPDDLCWVSVTSGTTSRPKLVPLTHRIATARIAGRTEILGLNDKDRWLNLLTIATNTTVTNTMRTLSTGGTVILTAGFNVATFFDDLITLRPTWLTAPSTMYQTIIANAPAYQDKIAHSSLRFIRSGTMALPPLIMHQLETIFNVPVIQGYGSTETGPIANNPLPPAVNKPGSVGIVTSLEVRIWDDAGAELPSGQDGEIIVRGPSVINGYEDDPEATHRAFINGWYRTGDLGHLDNDGYLFITGRLNEMINRGGEKIAPAQVENILLAHPVVAEAVVFAMPDSRLGQTVAAAVVLQPNQSSDLSSEALEREIRAFIGERLSPTRVPQRVVFLDELPKTSAGKLQRAGLAAQLGLTGAQSPADDSNQTPYVPPRTVLESALAELWTQVLGERSLPVGVLDEFLDVGGDSLAATRLLNRVRRTLKVEVSMIAFFDAPTISQQATLVEKLLGSAVP